MGSGAVLTLKRQQHVETYAPTGRAAQQLDKLQHGRPHTVLRELQSSAREQDPARHPAQFLYNRGTRISIGEAQE